MIAGFKSGLARFNLRTGAVQPIVSPDQDKPNNRINDGHVGPDGAIYFGTMDDEEKSRSGAFWRWDGKELTQFHSGIVVTNGPAFSPDGRILYATDTMGGRSTPSTLSDGRIGEPRPFARFEQAWGHPDGMAVDAEGHVWVCHWGASRITRFAPDGIGRAHRAGPDRAGHEMRLRRAGSDHALHHHRRYRPRPAYRPDGGPSLPGRDRRHPRPEDPTSSRGKHHDDRALRLPQRAGRPAGHARRDPTGWRRRSSPGARWCAISSCRSRAGPQRVVLGLNSIEDYVAHSPYFGAIVGRYANRIGGRAVHPGRRDLRLDANEGRNQLHGGTHGLRHALVEHRRSHALQR